MKKKIKIFLIITAFLLILILFCFLMITEKKKNTEKTEIDYSKWKELVKKDEPIVTILGQTWCAHCNAITPSINYIENKYGIKIYWFEIDEMEEEYVEEIKSTYNLNYSGTPHMFIIKNNKLIGEIQGQKDKQYYIDFLNEKNVIKK